MVLNSTNIIRIFQTGVNYTNNGFRGRRR